MPTTIEVKLKPEGKETLPVQVFFQVGDWAVTEALCINHRNQCFRLTHVPSTCCVPVCLTDAIFAERICKILNRDLPKFKAKKPPKSITRQCSHIVGELYI